MMNVVIVEDEHATALSLKVLLESFDCCVCGVFAHGYDALRHAAESPVDLALINVETFGDVNGVQSAIELRRHYAIPSVFISSPGDSAAIRAAMSAEPLGYLLKPFNEGHIELVLGVVKRYLGQGAVVSVGNANEQIKLGHGFSYNYELRGLFRHGRPVDLTPSELKLFELCLRRRGTTVPYEMVVDHVWGGRVVADSTRRGLYHRLRAKLDNNFFQTVNGLGCRIQLPQERS